MSYQIITLDFKIGDAGVTQSDDGSGGTGVTLNGASLVPPFGWTILNVVDVTTGLAVVPALQYTLGFEVAAGTPWYINASGDFVLNPYPIANGTSIFQVIAIAGS